MRPDALRTAALTLVARWALVIAPAAFAQAVPDTTAPWRYYPLGRGDVWEQNHTSAFEQRPLVRKTVVGDTAINRRVYAVVRYQQFRGDRRLERDSRSYERFDTTQASVVRWNPPGSDRPLFPCRLDAPFGTSCTPLVGTLTGYVSGSAVERVSIGTSAVTTAVKSIGTMGGLCHLAAGIGVLYCSGEQARGDPYLVYARVGGMEYGQRIAGLPVAGEDDPTGATFALAASPNPASGALRLAVTLPEAQTVQVEAFDALGRRVWHQAVALAVGSQTVAADASTWPPGVYVVRVRTRAGMASVRVVVAR